MAEQLFKFLVLILSSGVDMMRLVIFLLVSLCLCGHVQMKQGPSEEFDELEALLENIDQKSFDDLEKDVIKVKKLEFEKNPCEEQVCGWGKECVVNKYGEPACECIKKCPPVNGSDATAKFRDFLLSTLTIWRQLQVCSNTNKTFPSLCHLYREKCLCKKDIKQCENPENEKAHLEYLGSCKELDRCTDELMLQFPTRMADWLFQVMRELKKRRELDNLEWEELLAEAENDDEKRHVYPVIWKFCDLDKKPHDKYVSHHELIPITAPVIPMESCIKPFLQGCDIDNDGNISIKEWGKCLGLKEGQ
uniref:Follistatin-like domain-containing protein n=1 Tax=Syphacia muris TaxID=451379 RepID=A0A0N5AG27_9BILA